tara:strand:+ start:54565 stop:55371 length:807 start_codon:yes stop_codon:yes gene_type:complete
MTITKAILLTLLLLILFALVQIGILVPLKYIYHTESLVFKHLEGISTILAFLIGYAILFLFFWKAKPGDFKRDKFSKPNVLTVTCLFVIAVGLKLFYQPFFDMEKILNYFRNGDFFIDYPGYYDIGIFTYYHIISAIFIAPVCEELFFRKYMLSGLLKKYNTVIALSVSAICFSIIHIETPANLIPTFFFGIISGLVFIKTKNIIYSIALHLIMNIFWAVSLLLGGDYYQWLYTLNFNYVYWVLFGFGGLFITIGIQKINTASDKPHH